MRWFKPKHSVCRECGLHYEPVIGYEARWGDLCPVHRESVMERDLRKEAVISWASVNWKKIEPMYLEEKKETMKERMGAYAQQSGLGGWLSGQGWLGSIAGFGYRSGE